MVQSKSTYYILIISVLLNSLWSTLAANNTPVDNFSVDFTLVNGLIILEASVDSKKGNYILDTGCSFIALNEDAHQEGDIFIESSDFDAHASATEIQEFTFGNIKKEQLQAVKFDMAPIEQALGIVIDGVIGTEVTVGYNVLIDYELNKVSFISNRSTANLMDVFDYTVSKAKLSNHLNQSFITIDIQGESLTMLLDSGANISVLDQQFKKRFDSLQRSFGKTSTDDFTIDSVHLANVSIDQFSVMYTDLSKFQDELSFDGILSLSAINASKMLFDFDKGQVYFFWNTSDVASLD